MSPNYEPTAVIPLSVNVSAGISTVVRITP